MAFNPKTYWENRLKEHGGLLGVGYTRLGQSYNNWMYRVRRAVFLRQIRTLAVDPQTVLDIGSGTGFYIERWRELGARNITGVDLTQVAVENLKRQYSDCEFYELNIGGDDLGPLALRQFDAVSCMDVLFHIVDDHEFEQALHNLGILLKPGGLFVLSDIFFSQEAPRSPGAHMTFRSRRYFEQVLRQNGFEILKRAPMLVLMNQPVDSNSQVFKLAWKGLSVLIAAHEVFGFLIGALLYLPERALVATLKESPSVEIMLCRKP